MNRNLSFVFSTFLLSVALVGCDDPTSKLGRHNAQGEDDPTKAGAAALECTAAPQGRSYALFDGTKLEASRANENVGVNRARTKPFSVLEAEYKRVLGVVAPTIKDSASSFPASTARWYADSSYSAVSLNAIAELSYKSCVEYTKSASQFSAAPDSETARAECEGLMRKAWSRAPSPDELDACSELAVTGLADETNARKRWAYVCASVLSASQFLTF